MNAQDQAAARKALEDHRADALALGRAVARALQPIIPEGWKGKLTIPIDSGIVRPQDVVVEYRDQRTRTHPM